MKDFLKFFETAMDFKGLSFLVTDKSLIKKQRPFFLFFFATVIGQLVVIESCSHQEPENYICYRLNSVNANIRNERKQVERTNK